MAKFVGFRFARVLLGLSVLAWMGAEARGALVYVAHLDGPSEAPPNASPGTGFSVVTADEVGHTMRVEASFSGLLGTTTVVHIHAPTAFAGFGTAGVATQTPTFVGFPTGVTSGTYDHIFDTTLTSTYNPAFLTANGGTAASAEAALFGALAEGKAYFNLHTSAFGGGEIRGFFGPIPEPASLGVLGLGMVGLLMRRRARG